MRYDFISIHLKSYMVFLVTQPSKDLIDDARLDASDDKGMC